jgi:N-acyl-L-homoserine lactone synthetase
VFKVLSAANMQECSDDFASMHRLRHRVFIEELNWPVGIIRSVNGMEFDQFDIPFAHYIVRLNSEGQVDACTRLLPTTGPYLLGDVFSHLIQTIDRPNSPAIWETTRFCADRRTAPKNIVGQLVAAMIEFGLAHGITNYVSVSDIRIEPLLRRHGWESERIGEPWATGTDMAAGELFEVTWRILEKVRSKSGIEGPLLPVSMMPFIQRTTKQTVHMGEISIL